MYRCRLDPSDPSKFVQIKDFQPNFVKYGIEVFASIHVAYDALWVGVQGNRLYKCPLNSDNLNCAPYTDLGRILSKPTLYEIGSRSDGYIYPAASTDRMYKFNPNSTIGLCRLELGLPEDFQSFLILN